MATVTMSQARSTYSSPNSNQSGLSECDLTSKLGRFKLTDGPNLPGPTLVVCTIDDDNVIENDSSNNSSMMMMYPTSSRDSSPSPCPSPLKEPIERSPSTSSLTVPSIEIDEKRPPLPRETSPSSSSSDENMMVDNSLC